MGVGQMSTVKSGKRVMHCNAKHRSNYVYSDWWGERRGVGDTEMLVMALVPSQPDALLPGTKAPACQEGAHLPGP